MRADNFGYQCHQNEQTKRKEQNMKKKKNTQAGAEGNNESMDA